MPGAVIIGAGPGIGRSVALRFARESMPVALIAAEREDGPRHAHRGMTSGR
jgi:NAD(P)-dependent dehydrogenase (short-subunit alcohol dehydrogenase family)